MIDQPLLVAGEVTVDEFTTDALPMTSTAQGYTWFGERSTEACSLVAMANGGGCATVRNGDRDPDLPSGRGNYHYGGE